MGSLLAVVSRLLGEHWSFTRHFRIATIAKLPPHAREAMETLQLRNEKHDDAPEVITPTLAAIYEEAAKAERALLDHAFGDDPFWFIECAVERAVERAAEVFEAQQGANVMLFRKRQAHDVAEVA